MLVDISTGFVCQGNNGWYISRLCLLLTIWLVFNTVLSVVDKLVGISTGFVCHGQNWFVYLTVLSVIGNINWYINRFCLPCTIMFGLASGFVCHGQ